MSVVCFGVFDLFHTGHKYFLSQIRNQPFHVKQCIVILTTDEMVMQLKNKMPTQPYAERQKQLEESGLVDVVYACDPTLGHYLQLQQIASCASHESPLCVAFGYDQQALRHDLLDRFIPSLSEEHVLRGAFVSVCTMDAKHGSVYSTTAIRNRQDMAKELYRQPVCRIQSLRDRKEKSIIPVTSLKGCLVLCDKSILNQIEYLNGVDHVVSCMHVRDSEKIVSEVIRHDVLDVEDSTSSEHVNRMRNGLDEIVDNMHRSLVEGKTVVVHCIAGMSRSPTVVMYYLCKYHNMSVKEALDHVSSYRPVVYPNVAFLTLLLEMVALLA